jgi:signal transduction histidine kinase
MDEMNKEIGIPEESGQIQTAIGKVSLDDGVAVIEIDQKKPGPEQVRDHFSLLLGVSQQSGNIAMPVLMDMGDLEWIGIEARICTVEMMQPEWTKKIALYYRNPVQKVIAAFFVSVERPRVPIMITGDREAAMRWLKDEGDRSNRFEEGPVGGERLELTAEAVSRIALGELSTRVEVSSAMDQLDAINCGLNMLAEEMRGLFEERDLVKKESTKHREVLEGLVRERTAEVKEVNESLKLEIAIRKRAEERLEVINAELEGFAHMVSHDLKNPLTVIDTAAEVVSRMVRPEKEKEASDVAELFTVIKRSVEKAGALIEDLLILASGGQVPESLKDVDVGVVVRRVLEDRADLIARRGVSVTVDEDLGELPAGETHLYQVFSNLVDNSIQHNPGKGLALTVNSLGPVEGGRRYTVCDNGVGIPEDEIDKVFIPFFKGAEGQTGIGLSIVEKIVKLYGGEIRAFNDGGACFDFTIREFDRG